MHSKDALTRAKNFLTSVLTSDFIALFLSVFFSITRTRFLADFILGICYLLGNIILKLLCNFIIKNSECKLFLAVFCKNFNIFVI